MSDLHDRARARLAERQLDDDRTRLLRELLAENEQLLAENEELRLGMKAWGDKWDHTASRAEAAEATIATERKRAAHDMADTIAALLAENERLKAKLNTPETENFLQGVRFEVAHQVERWGTVHDRAKQPADWFWLVGYLSGKALAAHIAGDRDKALHHCISTAAVLANWHTHVLVGSGSFTPGSSDLQRFLTDTFGAEVPRG